MDTNREGEELAPMMRCHSRPSGVRTLAGLALTLAALGLGPTARAAVVIDFDPNGTAGARTESVLQFDEAVGNALAVGSILTPGVPNFLTPFTVLYQARIGLLVDGNGDVVAVPGFDTAGELTIVSSFREVQTITGPNSVSLSTNTDQTGSFVRIYFDPSNNADNLAGTGFDNGTLIYEGTVNQGGVGSFANTPGAIADFDNVGVNNYPGIQTVVGAGGTSITANTTFQDPNFFLTSIATLEFAFNTSNVVPFAQVNPSMTFAFAGVTPNLGPGPGVTINGFSGPDFQFQADANSSFQVAIPEPATVSGALVGVGLLGLGALRARRRRTESSAA